MPKEVIPMAAPGQTYQARLRWGHGTGMQLGVESAEDRSLLWLFYGEKRAELAQSVRALVLEHIEKNGSDLGGDIRDVDLGGDILNLLDVMSGHLPATADNPPRYSFMGIWADLDRRGSNDLIRYVRRARDDAFGRDE